MPEFVAASRSSHYPIPCPSRGPSVPVITVSAVAAVLERHGFPPFGVADLERLDDALAEFVFGEGARS